MGEYRSYTCLDCGKSWEFSNYYLLYRENDKIVENLPLMLTCSAFSESDLKGTIFLTFCEDCNKKVKIYSLPDDLNEDDKQRCIKEIKGYMKHKRPKFTIKTFVEDFNQENIRCPKCDKQLPFEYSYSRCPNCNSENIIESVMLAD
ncbi:MAG: hypothetical protein E7Z85_08085 [Methanosphaera stadtmanae]|nr:hypothetical protein [Methanosphaera stadtmanae]